jgi:hypothetical protein
MHKFKSGFIKVLGGWLVLSTFALLVVTSQNPFVHARISQATGLLILWIAIGGGIMYRKREAIRNFILSVKLPWG